MEENKLGSFFGPFRHGSIIPVDKENKIFRLSFCKQGHTYKSLDLLLGWLEKKWKPTSIPCPDCAVSPFLGVNESQKLPQDPLIQTLFAVIAEAPLGQRKKTMNELKELNKQWNDYFNEQECLLFVISMATFLQIHNFLVKKMEFNSDRPWFKHITTAKDSSFGYSGQLSIPTTLDFQVFAKANKKIDCKKVVEWTIEQPLLNNKHLIARPHLYKENEGIVDWNEVNVLSQKRRSYFEFIWDVEAVPPKSKTDDNTKTYSSKNEIFNNQQQFFDMLLKENVCLQDASFSLKFWLDFREDTLESQEKIIEKLLDFFEEQNAPFTKFLSQKQLQHMFKLSSTLSQQALREYIKNSLILLTVKSVEEVMLQDFLMFRDKWAKSESIGKQEVFDPDYSHKGSRDLVEKLKKQRRAFAIVNTIVKDHDDLDKFMNE